MCAKYYENPIMLSRVIAKNVGDVFFETHCRSGTLYARKVRQKDHVLIRPIIKPTLQHNIVALHTMQEQQISTRNETAHDCLLPRPRRLCLIRHLSVFLFVCLLATSRKTTDQIIMKISPEMQLSARKN